MRRGRSTGNPTKAEAAWLLLVKTSGCVCCDSEGRRHDPDGPMVEAHHLLSGGIRRGHMHTVGLCPWHHRGQLIVQGWSHGDHRLRLGPSLAEGSVPFHRWYGDDDKLMKMQTALLERRQGRAA